MNAESFSALLKQYANLYPLPYEALKTLALQYPYSQHLQRLLWEKSLLDQHPQLDQNLRRAALYASDRRHLYQRQKELLDAQTQVQPVLMPDEVLELKDLNTLAADLEKLAQLAQNAPPPARTATLPPPLSAPDLGLEKPTEQPNNPPPTGQPSPKTAFDSGVTQFQPDQLKPHLGELLEAQRQAEARRRLQDKLRRTTPPVPRSPNLSVEEQAKASIEPKPHIVSETLAELLARQEKYPEALAVYERLILLFPEKSAIFAAKIESIKKLLP